ncbi:hypothetical protein [Streptomyces aureoverticillatus]|uniref:hypothetical protein n=1 Tax=Streptomyces aureoverticillatus TaxID=66871 RepID=UPI0013DBAD69|nr:hypothetical protein [Streptomyces aureoverticillatus]QIB46377.1 hypothetical protein G3H79_28200 [Streptomyces aureoverticillatus]
MRPRRILRALALAATPCALPATAGCTDSGTAPERAPAPHTTSPEDICASLILNCATGPLRAGS